MHKTLLTALILFSFVGCSNIHVAPKIKVLERVPTITIEVDRGCICGDDTRDMFNLVDRLRKSESYYIEQITKYNDEFTE